jgi:RND family efflux transporter MFP subunit
MELASGAIGAAATLRLLALGGMLVATACTSPGDAKEEAANRAGPTPIVLAPQDVTTARIADVATGVLLTGSLEPAERATVTAQVDGTLGPMTLDRGSRVGRGQRITTIEAAGVRGRVAGARANVAAAEAQLEVARTQREAQRRLYDAGAISRVAFENAQAAHAAAEAQLAAARAQATAAEEEASYTVVTSPLGGVISDRPAEPGEAVRSGDAIVTVVNTATLELAGRIPVDEAGAVRVGQAVTFSLDAFPGREFRGTVARKDPAADPSTRQVGIYVRLPNPGGEITAGQYARGRVSGERLAGAITVPLTAVQGTGADAAVFVVEHDRLVRRAVVLGPHDDGAGIVAVTSGLRAGERVLARPTPSLTDGLPVVVASDTAAASVSPPPDKTSAGGKREP